MSTTLPFASLLIDLDRGYLPVCFAVFVRVRGHVIDTAGHPITGLAHWTTRTRISVSSPVTAEGRVKHDLLGRKFLANIASSGKVSERRPEGARVGSAFSNGLWNSVSREEPDPDSFVCPLHCIHSTPLIVKTGAISASTTGDPTTIRTSGKRTIRPKDRPRLTGATDRTFTLSVEDHSICILKIDPLNDI